MARLGSVLVAALLMLAAPVAGQSSVVEDCADCELTATLVVELGTLDGPGALGAPARIARRRNGQWVVTDYQEPSRLRFFGPDGEWIRTIGRSGQGPGEYDLALWVSPTVHDSLRVADIGQSRITTLTPALAAIRTQFMGRPFSEIVFLEDGTGRYVISSRARLATGGDSPVHLVSLDGAVVRSYGSEPALSDRRPGLESWRNIAVGSEGTLWTAKVTSYQLERWSLQSGEREQLLERTADWFPPQSAYGGGLMDPDQEPAPGLLDIDVDSSGRVWTGSHVGAENWRAAFEDGAGFYGGRVERVHDLSRYYDTIIEVISPNDSRVVGRTRLDGALLNFVGDGVVATWVLDPPGYPVIKVWSIGSR